ncbi:MAG: sulfite exporter TauE/SafE family protein [Betaproteobacteria bacterium]|nr:sulfite exporter TauE/SafE family protein [Betaproteobacteria bacterium]
MADALPVLLGGALLAGIVSGAHCGAMCGGIAGALQGDASIRLHRSRRMAIWASLVTALPHNAGRIASYALAGAVAGAAGSGWISVHDSAWLRQSLFALANLLLIALGVSLMFRRQLANAAERWGGGLWRCVRPLAARLMTNPRPSRRVLLGFLWGAMPCALIYAMLLSALASASAVDGALLMLAFGVGTLPNLLAIGLAWSLPSSGVLRIFARDGVAAIPFKALAGAVMLAFGVVGLFRLPALVQWHGMTTLCHPGLL